MVPIDTDSTILCTWTKRQRSKELLLLRIFLFRLLSLLRSPSTAQATSAGVSLGSSLGASLTSSATRTTLKIEKCRTSRHDLWISMNIYGYLLWPNLISSEFVTQAAQFPWSRLAETRVPRRSSLWGSGHHEPRRAFSRPPTWRRLPQHSKMKAKAARVEINQI